ncbi:MAG TPA: MFS transporter [Gammaproteobacteria bacterium]|nr:MFS transporter [Gammaproteobacteria bacterium]
MLEQGTQSGKDESPWLPFQYKTFRFIWVATVVSNVGTWMHDVGAAWLMTTLTSDPFMVAMIQAATAFPIFLFALPAGAMADIVDRRRYLLVVQLLMAITAISFTLITWLGMTTPGILIVFTFILGCGAAFNAPAWQAVTPELVPKKQLTAAVALNSIGINVSRAIGPALGGMLIVLHGPVLAFALNALSFVGIIWVLLRWQTELATPTLPTERFFNALRTGLRYARHSQPIHIVAIRAMVFFIPASAIWALLPLLTRSVLHQGAGGFGLLLATVGLGAVIGATQLPRLRKLLSSDRLVMTASAMITVCAFGLAFTQHYLLAIALMFFTGMAWIMVLSTLNVAAQKAAPSWVRARVLSVYLVVFFGSMAFGSAVWGQLASQLSISDALLIAAVTQFLGIIVTAGFRLQKGEAIDNAPSGHWPAPIVDDGAEPDQGPVLVTVEYHIEPEKRQQFLGLMQQLHRARKRDGAFFWSMFSDVAKPNRIIETFMTESWLEHLRQHERSTNADYILQKSISDISSTTQPPVIEHYVALR